MGSRQDDRDFVRAFGARVRALREQSALSQEALADRASLHRAEVGFLERGDREFGISVVPRLAAGLQVAPAALFGHADMGSPGTDPV